MNRFSASLVSFALLLAALNTAAAQDSVPAAPAKTKAQAAATAAPPPSEPPPPIYEEKLLRLSEILGSLSFLRDLCGDSDGSDWRDEMNALVTAENPPPQRRARLIARFNHAYEAFHAVYRTCTPSAQLAISRYLSEGQSLASDVRGRYSQ